MIMAQKQNPAGNHNGQPTGWNYQGLDKAVGSPAMLQEEMRTRLLLNAMIRIAAAATATATSVRSLH